MRTLNDILNHNQYNRLLFENEQFYKIHLLDIIPTDRLYDGRVLEIVFQSCTFEGACKLKLPSGISLKQLQITVSNCVLTEYFEVSIANGQVEMVTDIIVTVNNSIGHIVEISCDHSYNFKISDCYFQKITIQGNIVTSKIRDFIGSLAIHNRNANAESRVDINFSDQPKNRQQFISKKLRDKLLQNNYELKLITHCNFEIKNFKEIVVLGENDYDVEEVLQHNFYIDLKIHLYNTKAFVALHDFNANIVEIKGSNPQNNISLKNLNFSELYFKNVNANDIILENIKCLNSLKSKFEWNEVRFTASTFYLVDLSNVRTSIIRKSPIEKITIINSLFPPFINFSVENEENKENSLGYEFYRQLKTAFLKNNNTLQALQAHSKMFEYAMQRDDLDPWDKFILKLNHFSNRNGTSIAHALKTILLVTLISFLLLILSSPIDSDYCVSTWIRLNIYNRLNLIFYLLNPIFKVEDISKILSINSISFYQHFIMFMTRIGIGWSFYQFIAAFRKFGKH